ncbi:cryptochrome/photolyase family protein [Marinimicrobium agarilyticum]|uniref:cryptochrome/photolyase family protein n=1 Tax=Marinimicrobium agarilyticum TaxID=306546 RepID=UPI00042701D6|nr:cryptochrome/photolyase family protein [Marinimicrobium agarilyticum]
MVQVKLILGDQLNAHHSWFRQADTSVVFVMAELHQEADYVRHHRQKLLAFLAAMRQFAGALTKAGHRVRYFTLDDSARFRDLPELLRFVLEEEKADGFSYQQPDEYRLDQQLAEFCQSLTLDTQCADSEHFVTPKDAWDRYPTHRMEFFYRALRREHKVLLTENGKPEGGRWNFDGDNREALPRAQPLPEPLLFAQDVTDIDAMLDRHGVNSMGNADPKALLWPLSRSQSRQLLSRFLLSAACRNLAATRTP